MRAEPAVAVAALALAESQRAAAVGQDRHRPAKTVLPVRQDRPRRAHVSFCSRESDVADSRFGADVENADDILVSAGFVAANDYGLLGIERHEIFQKIG